MQAPMEPVCLEIKKKSGTGGGTGAGNQFKKQIMPAGTSLGSGMFYKAVVVVTTGCANLQMTGQGELLRLRLHKEKKIAADNQKWFFGYALPHLKVWSGYDGWSCFIIDRFHTKADDGVRRPLHLSS